MLARSAVVTLTGVGGVGKTRLATHVAGAAMTENPDGVWLCELAAAGDERSLEQVIAVGARSAAAARAQPRHGNP